MKQNLSLKLLCLIGLLAVATMASAQFLPQFGTKTNNTQVVRESELYDLDKLLGVNGSYIFIYDKQQCDTVESEQHGTFKAWDTLDSTLVMKGSYNHGVRDGVWEWYLHGRIIVEGNYSNGQPEGAWTFYNKNAKNNEVMVSCTIRDGRLDGDIVKYALKGGNLVRGFYLKEAYRQGTCHRVELYNEENVRCVMGEYLSADTLYFEESTTDLLLGGVLCETLKATHYRRPSASSFGDLEALVASMGTKDPKGLRTDPLDVVQTDSINGEKIVEYGQYKDNQQEGTWTLINTNQGYRLLQVFEQGVLMSRRYEKLKNGKPFSGKVTILEGEAVSVISIKKGVRNGKTTITDGDGKVTVVMFKDDKPVEKKK